MFQLIRRFRFMFRDDDYVYKSFLEAVARSVETRSGVEVARIGVYIMKNRPNVVARIFKFYKENTYGKGFSNKPEESVV